MIRVEPDREVTGDERFCAVCDGYVDVYLDEEYGTEVCALCDGSDELFESAADAEDAYSHDGQVSLA